MNITKQDLKTGMRVTLRDGSVCIIVLNNLGLGCDKIIDLNDNSWAMLSSYDQHLRDNTDKNYDIMKVEEPYCSWEIFRDDAYMKTVWKRKEDVVPFTKEELEVKLGYKIEIVEDKE